MRRVYRSLFSLSEHFRRHATLWGLVVLAGIFRLWIASLDHVLQGDEGAYVWLGKTLIEGGGYQFFGKPELHYTPFYPIVSGLVWLVVRDLELASKICFVVFGALIGVPVFLIAQRVYGRRTGYVAVALTAVAPTLTTFVYFWGSMTEPLFFFLLFSGLYCGMRAMESRGWTSPIAAGALLSLAYLTRPEGLVYVALMGGLIILGRWWVSRQAPLRALAEVAVMFAAFSAVALPYWMFLYSHLGRWSLTGKTWIAFVGHKALVQGDLIAFDRIVWGLDSTGLEVLYHSMDRFQRYSILGEILSDPVQFIRDTLYNIRQMDGIFLSKRVLPFFLLPLLGLGLLRSRWPASRLLTEIFLFSKAVIPALGLVIFTVDLRFYHATLIILLIWIAHGIVEAGGWLKETFLAEVHVDRNAMLRAARWERSAIIVCTVAIVAYFVVIQPAIMRDGLADKRFHYKAVGQWLALNSQSDDVIMSRGAISAIYANRQWVPFPHASYEDVLRYAQAHGVTYWIVHEREFATMRPQLAFLADRERLPAELEWVHEYEGRLGRTAVLRLKPAV